MVQTICVKKSPETVFPKQLYSLLVQSIWTGQAGVNSRKGHWLFSSPQGLHRLWDPPSFPSNDYQGVKWPGPRLR